MGVWDEILEGLHAGDKKLQEEYQALLQPTFGDFIKAFMESNNQIAASYFPGTLDYINNNHPDLHTAKQQLESELGNILGQAEANPLTALMEKFKIKLNEYILLHRDMAEKHQLSHTKQQEHQPIPQPRLVPDPDLPPAAKQNTISPARLPPGEYPARAACMEAGHCLSLSSELNCNLFPDTSSWGVCRERTGGQK